VTLGNPRLGFVCTGETVNGDPGLEGYYFEYDREIAPDERVRFAFDETGPKYNSAKMPKLDSATWPQERLKKVERSYAMEYVRSMLPSVEALFGDDGFRHVARAARLTGLQGYAEAAELMEVRDDSAESYTKMLAELAASQGESVTRDGNTVHLSGWRLMDGVALKSEPAFAAWNVLWEGMLAVHNRDLTLITKRDSDGIIWQVV
jgi:hypothetical protein